MRFLTTIDPTSERQPESAASEAQVAIEILFHSDFRRLGDRLIWGQVSSTDTVRPCVIGRDEPLFTPLAGGAPKSLADPCVSRSQVSVMWDAQRLLFQVSSFPEARRAIHVFDPAGSPLPQPPCEVPPGSLVAIGDRILLSLTIRPAAVAAGDMGLVGMSAAMTALRRRIATLARIDDSVLIYGETGTGKELVAQALHAEGPRRAGPFVPVNCAALPESLFESEFFGHAKGAYSGAAGARDGLFLAAAGGTIFLDEIGEMPLGMQAKMLRALELRRVRPVGSNAEVAVDVRIVAATNRDLAEEVRQGRFRADLFARLEAPSLRVPPLRERREDIPLLFGVFLGRKNDLQARALAVDIGSTPLGALWKDATGRAPRLTMETVLQLYRYDWPRNVRELERYVTELAATAMGTDRPAGDAGTAPPTLMSPMAIPTTTPNGTALIPRERPDEAELLRLLEQHEHVQARVARVLGVPPPTLDRWLREVGIQRPRDLTATAIADAARRTGGDMSEMARLLRVSQHGLRLRMTELGIGG